MVLVPNPQRCHLVTFQLWKYSKSFSAPSMLLLRIVGSLWDSGTSGFGGMGLHLYVLPRAGHWMTSKTLQPAFLTQKSSFLTQHSLPTSHRFLWPWVFQPEMQII